MATKATAAGFTPAQAKTHLTIRPNDPFDYPFVEPTGGATATISLYIKSPYPDLEDYTAEIAKDITKRSDEKWYVPEDLANYLLPNQRTTPITLTIKTTGATFDNGVGGPNYGQSETISTYLDLVPDLSSAYPKETWFNTFKPDINNLTFVSSNPVSAEYGVVAIGKDTLTATWNIHYKYHAVQSSIKVASELAWSPIVSVSGSGDTAVYSTTANMLYLLENDLSDQSLTITVTDTHGYFRTVSLPMTDIRAYQAPLDPYIASDFIAGQGSATATINWRLSHGTDINFANPNIKDIRLEYSVVDKNDWKLAVSRSIQNTQNWDNLQTDVISGLDPDTGYDFRVVFTSIYGDLIGLFRDRSTYVTMDFLEGGKGIALGQVANREGFDIAMPVYASEPIDLYSKKLRLRAAEFADNGLLMYNNGDIFSTGGLYFKSNMSTTLSEGTINTLTSIKEGKVGTQQVAINTNVDPANAAYNYPPLAISNWFSNSEDKILTVDAAGFTTFYKDVETHASLRVGTTDASSEGFYTDTSGATYLNSLTIRNSKNGNIASLDSNGLLTLAKVDASGIIDSGPLRMNGYHTISTTDSSKLFLQGGSDGSQGVQATGDFNTTGGLTVSKDATISGKLSAGDLQMKDVRTVQNTNGAIYFLGSTLVSLSKTGDSGFFVGNDGKPRTYSSDIYGRTYSYAANMFITDAGTIGRATSATKYKQNIEHIDNSQLGQQLLTLSPATWEDKAEQAAATQEYETGIAGAEDTTILGNRYYGLIAEDLVKAGAEELVVRNRETNEVEGINYDRIAIALIPVLRELRDTVTEQSIEISKLKGQK